MLVFAVALDGSRAMGTLVSGGEDGNWDAGRDDTFRRRQVRFYSRASYLDRAIDSPALRTGEHDHGFGAARRLFKAGHRIISV